MFYVLTKLWLRDKSCLSEPIKSQTEESHHDNSLQNMHTKWTYEYSYTHRTHRGVKHWFKRWRRNQSIMNRQSKMFPAERFQFQENNYNIKDLCKNLGFNTKNIQWDLIFTQISIWIPEVRTMNFWGWHSLVQHAKADIFDFSGKFLLFIF